jgi:hypothetical protein
MEHQWGDESKQRARHIAPPHLFRNKLPERPWIRANDFRHPQPSRDIPDCASGMPGSATFLSGSDSLHGRQAIQHQHACHSLVSDKALKIVTSDLQEQRHNLAQAR